LLAAVARLYEHQPCQQYNDDDHNTSKPNNNNNSNNRNTNDNIYLLFLPRRYIAREGFEFYDTWVKTMLSDIVFRNFTNTESNEAIVRFMTHSDQYVVVVATVALVSCTRLGARKPPERASVLRFSWFSVRACACVRSSCASTVHRGVSLFAAHVSHMHTHITIANARTCARAATSRKA
jgi:hypothetical protein